MVAEQTQVQAQLAPRFIKIGEDGEHLTPDAPEWKIVLDTRSGLMWSVAESKRLTWKKAIAWAKKLVIGKFDDWRLPTVEELFLMADRTKCSPAIDTAFFPGCESDWYWTSTPAAVSPGAFAWFVLFSNGNSHWADQYYECFVRAVRPSQ